MKKHKQLVHIKKQQHKENKLMVKTEWMDEW